MEYPKQKPHEYLMKHQLSFNLPSLMLINMIVVSYVGQTRNRIDAHSCHLYSIKYFPALNHDAIYALNVNNTKPTLNPMLNVVLSLPPIVLL